MERIIDADSHFMEPLDLWQQYADPKFPTRCLRFERDPKDAGYAVTVEDVRAIESGGLSIEELLGVAIGYGQKEAGKALKSFDPAAALSYSLGHMDKRLAFLDAEGFAGQCIFPTLGLLWEDLVSDPEIAATHCRAYNRWMLDLCHGDMDQLYPLGHVSLRHLANAVEELHTLGKAGIHGAFVGAIPIDGKSFGHPDFDPVWQAAQELSIAVGLHLVVHCKYIGNKWYREPGPGFMFLSMNAIQDPRMALTTMIYDGVFERFPGLRVATIESASGWIAEWLDRLDYRFSYMGHTCQMKRPASEYFARNIRISADPNERTLPFMVEPLGDDKFFVGSDYPHADGFTESVSKARAALARLPQTSVDKILDQNAIQFFGLQEKETCHADRRARPTDPDFGRHRSD